MGTGNAIPLDGYDPYSNSKSCSELVTHSYQKSFLVTGGVLSPPQGQAMLLGRRFCQRQDYS